MGDLAGEEGTMRLAPTLKHKIVECRNSRGEWTSSKKFPEQAWPHKVEFLTRFLKSTSPTENIMVFVNKKRTACKDLKQALQEAGLKVSLLSGLRRSRERSKVARNREAQE